MVGYVDEREVVPDQGREQDERRDGDGGEGGEESVRSRLVQPPASLEGRVPACEGGVEDKPEGDDERGAAELRHVRKAWSWSPARTWTGTSSRGSPSPRRRPRSSA